MVVKVYQQDNQLAYEFKGDHYLKKKEVRKLFGWDYDSVTSSSFLTRTLFITLTGQKAMFEESLLSFLGLKKLSKLTFRLDQIDPSRIKCGQELEARIEKMKTN